MARDAKVHEVALRMGLRAPQAESLEILAAVAGALPWRRDAELGETLAAVRKLCPKVEDFEREFRKPSGKYVIAGPGRRPQGCVGGSRCPTPSLRRAPTSAAVATA